MRTSLLIGAAICLTVICGTPVASARAAEAGNLYAGAARVDITPAPDAALPMSGYAGRTQGFQRIHDHIYVRAIVLSNGTSKAVLLSWELIFMPNRVWEDLSQRISKELGIPVENQMLAGEHDHAAPSLAGMFGGGRNAGRPPGSNPGFTPRPPSPGTVAYTAKVENDAFEAVRRAKENLRPAKFGYGTGKAYVNMNRREFMPGHGWDLGYNPDGPSDKTVAVLRFDDASTGKPIALFINYPVHGVVMGDNNLAVSGDLPGATSRFVEQYYQGKLPMRNDSGPEVAVRPERTVSDDSFVAVWTSGAAGDQNPIVMDSGEDFSMVDALGRTLGEESVRVANSITRLSQQVKITGAQQVVTCPGRRVTPGQHPANRQDFKFEDSDPVNIRLSLLTINDVWVSGVSGEVLTMIYQHLMKETPNTHTIMVTHANGSSGYIPNDAAFDQVSYEVTTSRLKPGCAEDTIVNGILELGSK
jgi:hypothetical protein